jgi:hypothetical protein
MRFLGFVVLFEGCLVECVFDSVCFVGMWCVDVYVWVVDVVCWWGCEDKLFFSGL